MDASTFKYNHLGSLAYIGADKGVWDVGRKMPIEYGEIGAIRGWLMGLTVTFQLPDFELHSLDSPLQTFRSEYGRLFITTIYSMVVLVPCGVIRSYGWTQCEA